jgi:hypothetical protein
MQDGMDQIILSAKKDADLSLKSLRELFSVTVNKKPFNETKTKVKVEKII